MGVEKANAVESKNHFRHTQSNGKARYWPTTSRIGKVSTVQYNVTLCTCISEGSALGTKEKATQLLLHIVVLLSSLVIRRATSRRKQGPANLSRVKQVESRESKRDWRIFFWRLAWHCLAAVAKVERGRHNLLQLLRSP